MIEKYINIYKNPSLYNKDFNKLDSFCLSIGVFDGIHKGHKKVLGEVIEYSIRHNCFPAVLTFSVNPKTKYNYINILSNKDKYLKIFSMNFSYIFELNFTDEVRNISGKKFLEELFQHFNIKKIIVGDDFKCGNIKSQLNANEITSLYPDKIIIVNSVCYNGVKISSSILREIIKNKGFLDSNDKEKFF